MCANRQSDSPCRGRVTATKRVVERSPLQHDVQLHKTKQAVRENIIKPVLDERKPYGFYEKFEIGTEQGWSPEMVVEQKLLRLGWETISNSFVFDSYDKFIDYHNYKGRRYTKGIELDVIAMKWIDDYLHRLNVQVKRRNNEQRIDEWDLFRLIAMSAIIGSKPVLVRTCPLTPRADRIAALGRVIDIHLEDLVALEEMRTIPFLEASRRERTKLYHYERRDLLNHYFDSLPHPLKMTVPWWGWNRGIKGPDYYSRHYENTEKMCNYRHDRWARSTFSHCRDDRISREDVNLKTPARYYIPRSELSQNHNYW